MSASGWDGRFNIDGYFTFNGQMQAGAVHRSYLQLFRSGATEMVSSFDDVRKDGVRLVNPFRLEELLFNGLKSYARYQLGKSVEPPVSVLAAIVNAKGAVFDPPSYLRHFDEDLMAIRSDVLLLPDALIETDSPNLGKLLRGAIDALWQAVGLETSPNYDAQDNWTPRR